MKSKFEVTDSTAIKRVEYDDVHEEISIVMTNGSRLVYGDVPPSVYKNFQSAPSKGGFFHAEIRSVFRYVGAVQE